MSNPICITVFDKSDIDGDPVFEGHQGHWADCYFSNATRRTIEEALKNDESFSNTLYEIRVMTDEEVNKYPVAVKFQDWLVETYGEC